MGVCKKFFVVFLILYIAFYYLQKPKYEGTIFHKN